MSVQYLIGRLEGAQPPQHPDQVGAAAGPMQPPDRVMFLLVA